MILISVTHLSQIRNDFTHITREQRPKTLLQLYK